MPNPTVSAKLFSPEDVYPIKHLRAALKGSGDYVYAYYGKKNDTESPFYVGKGRGSRVLAHWKNAVSKLPSSQLKAQEVEIRKILLENRLPTVKLLAYNVENTTPDGVYSLVERVIQDAFGIQKVWQKRPGMNDRVIEVPTSSLVQVREDSARSPVLSFDSLIGLKGNRSTVKLDELVALIGAPILLVGLVKTFHPSYSTSQLAEMARMYWNLDRFRKTSLPFLQAASNAALLAWRTLNGRPTIVGAWRIKKGTFDNSYPANRYALTLKQTDLELRRQTIGLGLVGRGTSYMGPRILLPNK